MLKFSRSLSIMYVRRGMVVNAFDYKGVHSHGIIHYEWICILIEGFIKKVNNVEWIDISQIFNNNQRREIFWSTSSLIYTP